MVRCFLCVKKSPFLFFQGTRKWGHAAGVSLQYGTFTSDDYVDAQLYPSQRLSSLGWVEGRFTNEVRVRTDLCLRFTGTCVMDGYVRLECRHQDPELKNVRIVACYSHRDPSNVGPEHDSILKIVHGPLVIPYPDGSIGLKLSADYRPEIHFQFLCSGNENRRAGGKECTQVWLLSVHGTFGNKQFVNTYPFKVKLSTPSPRQGMFSLDVSAAGRASLHNLACQEFLRLTGMSYVPISALPADPPEVRVSPSPAFPMSLSSRDVPFQTAYRGPAVTAGHVSVQSVPPVPVPVQPVVPISVDGSVSVQTSTTTSYYGTASYPPFPESYSTSTGSYPAQYYSEQPFASVEPFQDGMNASGYQPQAFREEYAPQSSGVHASSAYSTVPGNAQSAESSSTWMRTPRDRRLTGAAVHPGPTGRLMLLHWHLFSFFPFFSYLEL